jgi:hypothetical protein
MVVNNPQLMTGGVEQEEMPKKTSREVTESGKTQRKIHLRKGD